MEIIHLPKISRNTPNQKRSFPNHDFSIPPFILPQMNATTIIDIAPRIIRPSGRRNGPPGGGSRGWGGGDEDLRALARQIVDHDPALALLLARAGERAGR